MNLPLFFALFCLCARGLAELWMPKSAAYLYSLGGFVLFAGFFYLSGKPKLIMRPVPLLLVLCFMGCALISLMVSIVGYGVDTVYGYYLVYPIVVSIFFLTFFSITLGHFKATGVARSISMLILVLFFVAALQEFKLIDLPGATPAYGMSVNLARPSSLTGSYLHYPLIMVMLGVFLQALTKRITWVTWLAFFSVFMAFSRSGMMLVCIHLMLWSGHLLVTGRLRVTLGKASAFTIFALLLLITLFATGFLDMFAERILSSFDRQGMGNDDRFAAWEEGVSVIVNSNIWFGSNFGKATNLTSNLVGARSYVVESSLLQSLINFGVVGTSAFLALFYYAKRSAKDSVFGYFIIAYLLQSLVYQSVEVLPLIIGVFFLRSLTIASENTVLQDQPVAAPTVA